MGNNNTIKLRSDAEIKCLEKDLLNRRPFVSVIESLLKDNIETPFTIGLYGDWGTGKTSIMRCIEGEIQKDTKYTAIWFDAWEYENEESIVYPLISLLKSKLKTETIKSMKLELKKLTTVLVRGIGGIFTSIDLQKAGEEYEDYNKFDYWTDAVKDSRSTIKTLMQKILNENNSDKLVIFIDDLDRCLPENAIKLLESLKNIFCEGNCIFILALDKETIARGIKNRYSELTPNECKDYLDKIINFGLDIPELEDLDFNKYIFSLNKDLKLNIPVELIRGISEICVSSRFHNPRKLKRIFNKYFLILRIISSVQDINMLLKDTENVTKYKDNAGNMRIRELLGLLFLYEFWNQVFKAIIKDNKIIDGFNNIIEQKAKTISKIQSYLEEYILIEDFAKVWTQDEFRQFWTRFFHPISPARFNVLIRIVQMISLEKNE